MAEQSLKDKTVKGTFWSAIDNISQYAVSFIVGIVLARLLSPDDYGLIGLTAVFSSVCAALINGGFHTALIRKKDASGDDYNTVFVVNLGVSLLLYVIIYLSAPLIAIFFKREELIALTRVTSLNMIIGALALVQNVILTKALDFKSQTRISIVSAIVSCVVGLAMAFGGLGVWALVVQGLLSTTLRTILLWFHNKWVPKLRFSVKSFKELFGFGWKIMLSALLDSIWKQLYQVVVGRFYNPATLGQYTRAKGYSDMLSANLTSVVQRVTYPVLSSIQDDKARLVEAYRRIIKTTMFITAVSMFFLGAISEPLLHCLIGAKWHDASIYLPLICISGSLYPLHAINLNMLQVQGRSDLFLKLEIIKKTITMIPLFVGAFVGVIPMLFTNIITGIISYFLNSSYSGKLLGYSSWMQLKDVGSSYAVSSLIALTVYFLKYIPVSYWLILPLQLIVALIVFFLVCKFAKLQEYNEVMNMIKSYLSKT